jgi:hypothetical protein
VIRIAITAAAFDAIARLFGREVREIRDCYPQRYPGAGCGGY